MPGHGAESCGVLYHCFSEREEPHCPTGIPARAEEKVQGGEAAPTRSVGWEPGLGGPICVSLESALPVRTQVTLSARCDCSPCPFLCLKCPGLSLNLFGVLGDRGGGG